jgi:2'-5' RNA ligase
MTTLRTFVAVELDEELSGRLARVQDQLRGQLSPRSVRWVRQGGIHLTLKFLGDTLPDQVEAVKIALGKAVSGISPFTFTVGGLGCFPNARRPRVVWVGLYEPTGALSRLRDAVEDQVAPLGFPTENRPFHPHLTLGRVQRNASNSEVRQVGEVVEASAIGNLYEMTVKQVSYIKSDLKPGGAVYTTLYEARLQHP